MKGRCYVKTYGEYKHYGAKGIKVCDEWRFDFMAFYNWSINNGYADHLSLDRIDYCGNYEPNNCRWATSFQQANNRSNNVNLTNNGETHTISEWSRIVGIKKGALQYRKYIGMSDEKILTTPIRGSNTKPIIKTNEQYLYRDDFGGIIHKLGLPLVQKAINRYKKTWKARQVCQRLARIKQLKKEEGK